MRKVKSIIGVMVIFLLGTFCGALGVHIAYKTQIAKYMSGDGQIYRTVIVRHLSKKLDLDQEQKNKIRDYIKETQTELHNVRKQVRPQIEIALEKSRLKLRSVLRPEQIERYDKLIDDYRAKTVKDQ
ncbi:MAG: hypothetical protein JW925_13030 [Syntrophaceae bacterium]|nr:hypothetical protein [Syntrophaceae bacterium]